MLCKAVRLILGFHRGLVTWHRNLTQEQPHEHQSMEGEVEACKKVMGSVSWCAVLYHRYDTEQHDSHDQVGDAYVLGPLTGEHWLFYDALYLSANQLQTVTAMHQEAL